MFNPEMSATLSKDINYKMKIVSPHLLAFVDCLICRPHDHRCTFFLRRNQKYEYHGLSIEALDFLAIIEG
jgi:hypothetical protein